MKLRAIGPALAVLVLVMGCAEVDTGGGATAETRPDSPAWHVTKRDDVLQIAYGTPGDLPQVAALHLSSSYFRMVYGRGSGWGTSVVLLPSFWANGKYHQGAPVSAAWSVRDPNLALSLDGVIGGLQIKGQVVLSPPGKESLSASVSMQATGTVALDAKPGQAFKPVMLSSMRISERQWDAESAYAESQAFPIPQRGWIIHPAVHAKTFGLMGGHSEWKPHAPTVEVAFDRPLQITGWVTPSNDPNDDNVGFWGACDTVPPKWTYEITARR